jgi:hypothetical protein
MMKDSRMDPVLLLKIPMGTRKNFSENYRKFGHARSKSFASPALVFPGNLMFYLSSHLV